MPKPVCPDDEFIELIQERGIRATARHLNVSTRSVNSRRRSVEKRLGIFIEPGDNRVIQPRGPSASVRLPFDIKDGIVVVAGDCHYMPNDLSTAHCGMVNFIKQNKSDIRAVIFDGDVTDGGRIGNHPPIGWESAPTFAEELEACQERLHEVQRVAPKDALFAWCLGNHDQRFETLLQKKVPELEGIHGLHLKDHFPDWKGCMSVAINEDPEHPDRVPEVMVKHRFKGGIHATHLNPMYAGTTIVTGHLHQGKRTPFTTYRGTIWGVDVGMIAEPYGAQFEYMEDNPRNWISGFGILAWEDGRMLRPELAQTFEHGIVEYWGKRHAVTLP